MFGVFPKGFKTIMFQKKQNSLEMKRQTNEKYHDETKAYFGIAATLELQY